MKVPTTEFCSICEMETPKEIIAKLGRTRTRVFQDLDTGKYACERGHEVNMEPAMPEVAQEIFRPAPQPPTQKPGPAEPESDPHANTATMVAERPAQVSIVPGSENLQRDGTLHLTLIVPEQYVQPLQEYCRGIGKTVEEFVGEVFSNGFENGWFI